MHTGNGEEFDVVVAGGGPGGSTLAAIVAMRGHRVLVLENEYGKFTRYARISSENSAYPEH